MGSSLSIAKCPGCGQPFKGYELVTARNDYHEECVWRLYAQPPNVLQPPDVLQPLDAQHSADAQQSPNA